MLLWGSACSNWQWMVRHITVSFCNWLVMSSKEKMIRRIFFWRWGLAMSPQIRKENVKKYSNEAYIYIWNIQLEEFVMFTPISFNRSQHAILNYRGPKAWSHISEDLSIKIWEMMGNIIRSCSNFGVWSATAWQFIGDRWQSVADWLRDVRTALGNLLIRENQLPKRGYQWL